MDHSLVDSMMSGIDNSKVALVCIHPEYEKSTNCMLELNHAIARGKPLVSLVTAPGIWGNNSWVTSNIRNKLGLHGQGNLFIDISGICVDPGWRLGSPDGDTCVERINPFKTKRDKDSTASDGDDIVPIKLKIDLHAKLDDLVQLLTKPQINCHPSM